MSEQRPSDGLLTRADLMADIVLARLAGAPFAAIASLHEMRTSHVRYYVKRAIKEGYTTKAELAMRDMPRPQRISESAYKKHWLKLAKAKTRIDANGCWLWTASRHPKGYGQTMWRGKTVRVHRKSYEILNNVRLKETDFICHHCDVRHCWNPQHLFLGNNMLNMADKTLKGRHHELRVTHCPRGHAYDSENTYRSPSNPRARQCKSCMRDRAKLAWRKKRDAA